MSSIALFVRPPEWEELQPFAEILVSIVLRAALRPERLARMTPPPQSELEELSQQIQALIQERMGASLHPAIWVHALKVCCHFYGRTIDHLEDRAEQERQQFQLDSAYVWARFLELHHGLYDLYITLA